MLQVLATHLTDPLTVLSDLGICRELLAEGGLVPLPGVVDLLSALRSAGIPCSLGSSTSRKNIEVCLETAGLV